MEIVNWKVKSEKLKIEISKKLSTPNYQLNDWRLGARLLNFVIARTPMLHPLPTGRQGRTKQSRITKHYEIATLGKATLAMTFPIIQQSRSWRLGAER